MKKLFSEIFNYISATLILLLVVWCIEWAGIIITGEDRPLTLGWLVNSDSGRYETIIGHGASMGEDFPQGSVTIDTKAIPKVGDIVSFDCLSEKCMLPGLPDGISTPGAMHRLTAIESNGCMHIEGDNQPIAWDTRDYGCLMPYEIQINGVVISSPFSSE